MQADKDDAREEEAAPAERALLIDPPAFVQADAEEALREAGFEVHRPYSLREAVLKAFTDHHHLLIIAHQSPRLDSPDVVRALRMAADCASRRAQMFVVAPAVDQAFADSLRHAGVSQLAIAPLDRRRIEGMLKVMKRDRRTFIQAKNYVGPDRRVKQLAGFGLQLRRRSDLSSPKRALSVRLPDEIVKATVTSDAPR